MKYLLTYLCIPFIWAIDFFTKNTKYKRYNRRDPNKDVGIENCCKVTMDKLLRHKYE